MNSLVICSFMQSHQVVSEMNGMGRGLEALHREGTASLPLPSLSLPSFLPFSFPHSFHSFFLSSLFLPPPTAICQLTYPLSKEDSKGITAIHWFYCIALSLHRYLLLMHPQLSNNTQLNLLHLHTLLQLVGTNPPGP